MKGVDVVEEGGEGGVGGFLFLERERVSKVGFGVLLFELGWFWRGGCDVLTGSSWSLSSWIVPLTQGFVGVMVMRLGI